MALLMPGITSKGIRAWEAGHESRVCTYSRAFTANHIFITLCAPPATPGPRRHPDRRRMGHHPVCPSRVVQRTVPLLAQQHESGNPDLQPDHNMTPMCTREQHRAHSVVNTTQYHRDASCTRIALMLACGKLECARVSKSAVHVCVISTASL